MRTLCDFFGELTLREAWENDEAALLRAGMSTEELELLRKICNLKVKKPSEAFRFLSQRDDLFCSIYGLDDRIPFHLTKLALARSTTIRYGEFGEQGFAESISQGASLMAYRLDKRREQEFISAAIAALCFIGKKYTASTNEDNMICFPKYSIVSAYIASAWLRNGGLSGLYAKGIVSTIYAHTFPFNEWMIRHDPDTGVPVNPRMQYYGNMLELMDGNTLAVDDTMILIKEVALSNTHLIKIRHRDEKQIEKGTHIINKLVSWTK